MVIPRPENNGESVAEDGLTELIAQAESTGIEAVVMDLGADVRAPFWDGIIERADVSFLVLDTDGKALDRARRFLAASMQPPEGCGLGRQPAHPTRRGIARMKWLEISARPASRAR